MIFSKVIKKWILVPLVLLVGLILVLLLLSLLGSKNSPFQYAIF